MTYCQNQTQPMNCSAPYCISLVIATLHDDGDLEQCLSSLTRVKTSAPFEVIVVDQNGDDRLLDMIAKFSSMLALSHHQVNFRGASRARNFGAQHATGQWLGFPDDDCQFFVDTLQGVETIAANPEAQIITGQTVDEQGSPNVLRWSAQPLVFDRWSMFRCVTEATLFVRRDLFCAAGGFDVRFGPGARYPAAEGIELVGRLFERMGAGQAHYSPTIKMQHPSKIPPWTRWAVGRFYSYAVGDGALIAKCAQPHIWRWGAKTLASAILQALCFDGWRSLAFTARIAGVFKGYFSFQWARMQRD